MREDVARLTFRDLQFLLMAEKFGSLTKAGAVLQISPSGASRALAHIREKLRDPCFVFAQGELVPTAYFVEIRPVISDILSQAEGLQTVPFEPKSCTRTFRFTCMMAEAAHIVGGILPMMLREAPHSTLHVSKSEAEFSAVLSGQADFAIVTAVDMPPEVHALRLYPIDRVILLRKNHPLTKLKRPLRSYDLQFCDRVTIQTGRAVSWTGPDQNIFPYEKYLEHSRFTTSRFNLAWEAMEKTDLIAVCGFRAAEIAMRQNNLTCLPLPEDVHEENVWNMLVWSDITHRDSACIWLRRIFARWAEEEEVRVRKLMRLGKAPIVRED